MPKLSITKALDEVEASAWQCKTCTAPAEEDSRYCHHCRAYWNDVANGLFDNFDEEPRL